MANMDSYIQSQCWFEQLIVRYFSNSDVLKHYKCIKRYDFLFLSNEPRNDVENNYFKRTSKKKLRFYGNYNYDNTSKAKKKYNSMHGNHTIMVVYLLLFSLIFSSVSCWKEKQSKIL